MSEWPLVRFGDLASSDRSSFSMGPFGSKIVKENYVADGIPVVRGVNLSAGRFIDAEFVFITPEKADELSSANVAPGDLIFTHRGTIGQVTMIPRRPRYARYVIGSSQVKARLDNSRALPEFYYYWFRSPRGQQAILANVSTVGVPGLATPLTTIKNLVVPQPPLAVQGSIAAILGALDDKIAVNHRVSNTALDVALSQYERSAKECDDWRTVSMGDSADWQSGGTPDTSEPTYWNGTIPWISAISLKSPWIDNSERCVTESGACNGTRLVPANTIIFVVRGSSLDSEFRIGITGREVAFGQDCKALRAKEGIDPAVLFLAIKARSKEILGMVDHAGHGAGRLATELITNVHLKLPPANDRSAAVVTLRALTMMAADRQRESRSLTGLRNALLPGLISGELHIKDAERIVSDAV